MKKRQHCNICNHNKFKILYKFEDYNVIECQSCRTLCRDIIFEKDEIEKLYAKDYFCELQKDFFFSAIKLREKAFERKMGIIEKFYPQKGRLLDLGCAIGTFLKIAQKRGWEAEGVEISKFAATYAKEKEKLKVYNYDFINLNFPADSFDVVSMWDMVDHSETPNETLKEVYRILKPGGIVAMDTFMDDALLFTLSNYVYKFSFGLINYPTKKAHPIHHSHHFSRKTFRYFLKKNQFDIIFEKGSNLEGGVVSLGYFGKKVVSIFNFLSKLLGKEMEVCLIGRKN